ncbi:MAG: RimK family alpha-L-glutamate ligase, partial [Proteobacteria bacterium]|nr:RimK family alpha-L-glutamate ligase [Pseudomonadota bacterium]
NITLLQINEIPESHHKYFLEIANDYFSKKRLYHGKKINYLYDLAILVDQDEKNPPSNQWAINKFIDRAESHGFRTRVITKDDYSRIAEFDALFIRTTTVVNHYTYRFARRATAEGLTVLDDPLSIIKCANKVYLAELLAKAKIKTPKTMIVHKENKHLVGEALGYPCVLKLPDSAFSHGVVKIENPNELKSQVEKFFEESDLLVAQEFIQTEFDWRIGILNNQPFFACKYFMAKEHWQIYNWNSSQNFQGGDQAIALEEVPPVVIDTALKAANLIGNGLYGVDLKHHNDQVIIIEINDNPSIDHGIEDNLLKDNVYDTIIQYFVSEIQKKKL